MSKDNQEKGTPLYSQKYRGYVLGLLVLVGIFAWMDRNILSILLESIRLEFDLSDTELGLLGGLAFGLFYASMGLPLAWIADRYNRRNLISIALALWSAATALCGLATSFATLFMARIGVGVGEAGASPPAHSLISDYFPPNRRGFALGIYYLFIPLGYMAGFLFGGWLNEFFDWRIAFIVVGAPGILLAVIVRFTLKEPTRGLSEGLKDDGIAPSFKETMQYIFSRRSLRHLPMGGAIHSVGLVAAAVWLPSYFSRSFGMSIGEVGTWMAIAFGLFGGIGVLFGGYLSDELVKRSGDERWYPKICGYAIFMTIPFAVILFLSNSLTLSLFALCVWALITHTFLGPVTAMLQNLAGVRRRAMVAAMYLFLSNIVSSIGPVLVGTISDLVIETQVGESLGFALLVTITSTGVWSAIHFFYAAKHVKQDLARTKS